MKENYLFIGGPYNGEWARTDGSEYIHRPVLKSINDEYSQRCDYVEYFKMRLSGESKIFEVYVLNGLDGSDVMRALISNYRNPWGPTL
jgi:hypothetical protein